MKQYVERFVDHPYFEDKLLRYLVGATGLATISVIVLQVLGIESVSFQVPVQYSSTTPFITNGDWWQLLRFPLFTVAATVINILIAVRLFRMSRAFSVFATFAALVVTLLSGIVSWAVLGLT